MSPASQMLTTKSVSPADCAIAFGLPLQPDIFARQLEAGGQYDFAASVSAGAVDLTPSQVWEGRMARIADEAEDFLQYAASLGAAVLRNAAIADLPALFGGSEVVIVIGHWRTPWVCADQVIDPRRIAEQVSRDGRFGAPASAAGGASGGTRDHLVARLNDILDVGYLGPSRCPEEWHRAETESYRVYANRVALDDLLSPALAPAPPFELADGMHTVDDLLDHIPTGFNGVLDLTVCNSMIMVDEIKRERRFTCLGNERPTKLGFRLELCGAILNALARCPMPYPDAARDIRIALSQD
jgi:hypothetical protein